MEPASGVEERRSRNHAADARNSEALRSAQPVCGRGKHSWRSRISGLKQRFHGDLRLITAAYYVGEVAISLRGLEYCSPAVQDYVKRIARRYQLQRALRGRSNFGRQR